MQNKELALAIKNNTVSHAYIFYDEDEAFDFANCLGAIPADFIIQENLLTKDIEELEANLKIKPFGDIRVVVIKNADNMQTIVQNKLLKTLEEPLGNTVIILCASRREVFLPTILSRCVEITSTDKELEYESSLKELAKEFIAKGPLFYARKSVIADIDDKETALGFLNALESLLREDLISTFDSDRLKKQILKVEDTRKSIESGFSMANALKALALDM